MTDEIEAELPGCRHCGNANANRPRGLCWHCYMEPGVREQYPPRTPIGSKMVAAFADPDLVCRPKPERSPGDPPWRCLWCLEWRCSGPLMKCEECEESYRQMVERLPVRDRPATSPAPPDRLPE